jgi:LuxR family transcriptional regulator
VLRLLDLLETVTRATSVEAVWQALTCESAAFGFDRLIYGFTRNRTARSFGQLEDVLILTNHDAAYTDRFIGDRMFLHAPMVRWAAGHEGACSWAWIRENWESLTPEEQRVAEFNRQMGVTAGWSVSFPSVSPRAKGAIAFTARAGMTQDEADAVWASEGRRLEQMATVAHLKIITLPHSGTRRPLTGRQREVLEWVGEGKTMLDIATIMGLTPATVEKHMRLAREALEVETTAQAVLKAAYQNQIFVVQA